jgi:hypothetical protein
MPEELLDDSNALGYLRSEHESIQQLLATVTQVDQPQFAKQVVIPLIQELSVHAAIEDEYFFPFMQSYVPEDVLARPASDNSLIREMTRKLETLDPADPEFLSTLDRLIERFQHHVYIEEQYLFLSVEGKDPTVHNDLIRLANSMKHRKSEMLAAMKEPRVLEGTSGEPTTAGEVQLRVAQEKGRHLYPPRDVLSEDEVESLDEGAEDTSVSTDGVAFAEGGRRISLDHDSHGSVEEPGDSEFDSEGIVGRAVDAERAAPGELELGKRRRSRLEPAPSSASEMMPMPSADHPDEKSMEGDHGVFAANVDPLMGDQSIENPSVREANSTADRSIQRWPVNDDPLLAEGTEDVPAQEWQTDEEYRHLRMRPPIEPSGGADSNLESSGP